MVRNSPQDVLRDQARRRRPVGDGHVHVKLLQHGSGDQIAPAGQNAGALRSADRLAAAIGDQVRAIGDKTGQVCLRRQLGGGVDDHRQVMGVSYFRDLGQRWVVRWAGCIGDGDRRRPDGGGDLPRLHAAHASAHRPIVKADLADTGAGGADRMVVAGAMVPAHHHLARHAVGVGQAVHGRRVHAGEASRGG